MAKGHTPTSVDVARRAGVSQATVSLVFTGAQGRIRISDDTRERVMVAAAELGYSPHPLARALRQQRSGIIGFVPRFHHMSPTTHPVPFLLGSYLARAAQNHGRHVIEVGTEGDPVLTSGGLIPFLRSRRVDGVIFDGPENPRDIEGVCMAGLPVVQIIRPLHGVETATITVDPAPGITAAVDHLVALGHHAIGFLGRGGPYPVDQMRLDSFTAALARHGLAPPENASLLTDYSIEESYAATRAILAGCARPTALFVAGDNLALGALRALHEAHVRVPDAMSVVTYDDILAADLYPPLSSVVQPLAEVSERAIALILMLLDPSRQDEEMQRHLVLPTRFLARASTQPPSTKADIHA